MTVIGIIAEYNPFHNGHAYQIESIRRQTNADYIVVAMSGNFVQRGAPALIDKYARARMALSCGADLVVELPAIWSVSSAEAFAEAGISLFEQMGCVDGICFGAESDRLPLLKQIAAFLTEEPSSYQNLLSSYLKEGFSFPAARAKATADCLCADAPDAAAIHAILCEPNNILAIEYLKSLKRQDSKMLPYLIKREGAGYHESKIRTSATSPVGQHAPAASPTQPPTASATAIRRLLLSGNDDAAAPALAHAMPQEALSILGDYLHHAPLLTENDFSAALCYLLFTSTKEQLASLADSNADIASRIFKNRFQAASVSGLCAVNKSRDVTYTRISRILFHLLLQITKDDIQLAKDAGYVPYLRLLGFRKDSAALLSELKRHALVPLISKLADASKLLAPSSLAVLEKDIFAANLYEQTRFLKQQATSFTCRSYVKQNSGHPTVGDARLSEQMTLREEYTRKLVVI